METKQPKSFQKSLVNTILKTPPLKGCQFLIKELKPGQYVVMDNASFHKSHKTKDLIESVGCKVIFLPPYSPDFNPIEKFWANMKRWLENNRLKFDELYNAISCFFKMPNPT